MPKRSPQKRSARAPQAKPPRTVGASGPAKSPHHWTFLTNHAHVLILLHTEPELVLREVALRVGITERAVQRIVHELVDGGVLEREKVGRRNRYKTDVSQPLRHPIESHRTVKDLLRFVTGAPPEPNNAARRRNGTDAT